MDVSFPLLHYSAQYPWSCPSSDSEFYNVSSPETVSPSSSYVDFSPSCLPLGTATAPHSAHSGGAKPSASPSSCEESGHAGGRTRRSRSKNPSKQRQSASEKEKLRMRDLTKALNHLRTYLPPSVAPAGQTLTKIETLRLTIRYISHLSAQLELGEEAPCQRKEPRASGYQVSPQVPLEGSCPYSSATGHWGQGGVGGRHAGQCQSGLGPAHPFRRTGAEQHQLSVEVEVPAYDDPFNSSTDSLLECPLYAETAPSCQEYRKDMHYQGIAPEFWI